MEEYCIYIVYILRKSQTLFDNYAKICDYIYILVCFGKGVVNSG